MQRLLFEIIAAMLLLGGFVLYERHAGAQACHQADTKVALGELAEVQVKTKYAIQTIVQEKETYAAAKLSPVATAPRVYCVRVAPAGAVLPSTSAGPFDMGAGRLPGAIDRVVPATADIAAASIAIGRNANAQVNALKDYISKVCLP